MENCCRTRLKLLSYDIKGKKYGTHHKYNFVFEQKDGRLTYHLDYAAKQVIEEGELGVNIDNHLVESAMGIPVDNSKVWTRGMEVLKVERTALRFIPVK